MSNEITNFAANKNCTPMTDLSFEALAHYTRGMATMFFLVWAAITYTWRKRNRMSLVLFVAVSYVALGYAKDIVFLFTSWMKDPFVETLVGIFDITCTPIVCAFFLEATRPGTLNVRRLVCGYLVFLAFVPLYCLFPVKEVLFTAYFLSALTSLVALVIVPFNVVRYNKYLSDNFSYTQDISIGWVVGCAICYFLWFFVYALCFSRPTWYGEVAFDLISIVIWMALCLLSRRHKVVFSDVAEAEEENQTAEEEEIEVTDSLALSLQLCMEKEKVYLNPHLSLADLALAVGSNKTYLSTYLNQRGKTFYDFVNEYRIAEACRIIDTKPKGTRLAMADVATRSGFNSISSFNRYFNKIMGVSPSNYIPRTSSEPEETELRINN